MNSKALKRQGLTEPADLICPATDVQLSVRTHSKVKPIDGAIREEKFAVEKPQSLAWTPWYKRRM